MVDFPTGSPDIPSAISGNPLATMHGATSQTAAMNRVLANLVALADKMGSGASLPGSTPGVLRRTATGASGWGLIQGTDLGTGTARAVTRTVAASDASALTKAMADHVCDGTADQVEIQAAHDALPAGGGELRLSEGTFNLSGSVTLSKFVAVTGMGWSSVLRAANGLNAPLIDFADAVSGGLSVRIAHLKLDGNGPNQTAGACIRARGAIYSVFDHLYITTPYDVGLLISGSSGLSFGASNRVTRCAFDGGFLSPGFGQGVRIQSSFTNTVEACYFENMGVGAEPYAIKDMGGSVIAHCGFYGGGEGIRLTGYWSTVLGCRFTDCGRETIYAGSSMATIVANIIQGGGSVAAGTYGHITLDNGGQNIVQGNIFTPPGTNGQLRHIIRTTASGGNNVIVGNQFNTGGTLSVGQIDEATRTSLISNNQGFRRTDIAYASYAKWGG